MPLSPPIETRSLQPGDNDALAVSVEAWVPMRILELRGEPAEDLARLANECARRVGEQGDLLEFGASGAGEVWAELVTGLAALAILTPGGVTWRGMHWCEAPHPGCPLAPLANQASPVIEEVGDAR